jgi:hypothetical protein
MVDKFKRMCLQVAIFVRLVDAHDETLSITNIAVYIVLVKLALAQQASLVDCGGLLISLSHYGYKKYINKDVIAQATSIANQIVTKADELSSS